MKLSFSVVVFGVFIGYICYTLYSFYLIFVPTTCKTDSRNCLKPYLARHPNLTISLYATPTRESAQSAAVRKNLLGVFKHLNPDEEYKIELNYTAPLRTCRNGTLFVHAYLTENGEMPDKGGHLMYQSGPITRYTIPEASTYQLVGGAKGTTKSDPDALKSKKSGDKERSKPVTHLYSTVAVSLMSDLITFDIESIPGELYRFLRHPENSREEYLPVLYVDDFSIRTKDLLPLNESCGEQPLTLLYRPISFGKLRLWVNMKESMAQLRSFGFTEKDVDEVKGLFVDTNLYLLLLTFFIAAFHLLFDFLAFKNDISYWRNRKSMAGLSSRTVVWRCVSTMIVFLYLHDEKTSLLVLVPSGIGAVIEIWKVFRAFKISLSWTGKLPSFKFGEKDETEKQTADLDSTAMKYLSYVLYPLIIAGAIYSLLYTPHKSWYSWCIQSLVNGVYAFGFIFMLPQLFINYKLKSVAHLPWRAFMYKAFNTFIDDVFAFIITMPTAHRLACFRDDLVFLIYLYQRWLYPVDKTRVNEYGQSFENDSPHQNDQDKKTK